MAKATVPNPPKKEWKKIELRIGGTGLTDKAILAKHLSVMQQAGLNIVESLAIVEDSARGRMKSVLGAVKKSVESGNSLADSLKRFPKVFNGIFISEVYAGETSGTLSENLKNLAEQLQKEKELSSKIKGAMLYPSVILVASFILGMVMSFMVLPKIIPLFEGLKTGLPPTTRALINFSHFVSAHPVSLPLGIILGIIFLIWLIRQKFARPVTNWILLHTPIIKTIVRNTNLARFARTLATLLRSGLNIDEALDITHNTVSNYYFQKVLDEAGARVRKGTTLAENLVEHEKLFPRMVTRMVRVGEESGNLEDTLLYLADFYEIEVDNSTKSLSTAIEPVLLIIIGLVVGFLALSIITPIYNITGDISR